MDGIYGQAHPNCEHFSDTGAEGVQQKRRNEGDQPQGEEDVDAGQQLEPGNNGTQPQGNYASLKTIINRLTMQ